MEDWVKLSIRIGTFGFLKEFRPEDPYITQYLVGPVMKFNETVVNQQVYPIATYVSLFDLIIVFLLTDWLRYKPVIAINALCGVISQALLIWCRSLQAIQVMEVFYGTMTACEVAYYTYIYAKVDKEHYQAVTSHMRAAALTGRFMSGMTAQILLLTNIMNVAELNHLTFAGMLAALLWAITLPSMKHSLYFHRDSDSIPCSQLTPIDNHVQNGNPADKKHVKGKCNTAMSRLWSDLVHAYTNPYVIKWSFWWALATCGYLQFMSYVQLLWNDIAGQDNIIYNGAVEASYTLISAFSAFMFGRWKADWSRPDRGELLLGVLTLIEGCSIVWSAFSHSIWEAYLVYIIFGALYHIMMTVSNSEVARHIRSDSYALIFGVNTFISLILQTSLTYTVAANGGLQLNIRDQFAVYGSYFCILGLLFLVKSISSIICSKTNSVQSYNL